MKRKREICETCKYFFNGVGEHNEMKYAFCMNTDLHGDSAFYEFVARANPNNCPEENFFGKDYEEDVFSECPFKAEHIMVDINEKTT